MNSEELESELILWDKQFTEDVKSGRFFWLTNKWIIDFEKGDFKNFWNCYEKLQNDIKILTDKTFSDLKKTREHPSLKILKAGRYWSLPIGEKNRALGVEVHGSGLLWCWVGSFSDYNSFLETINNEESP
ncbi:hypothetical protein N9L33_00575 [Nitrospinae bacterium]|nr:hypothetical protein [Nitrospinota bacterium]